MTLSVPGVPASCEKFPHSSQLNFWSTESIFNQFSVFLKTLNALCVCLQYKHPRSMKRVIKSDKPVTLLLLLWSHICDFGAEPRSHIIATSAVKGLIGSLELVWFSQFYFAAQEWYSRMSFCTNFELRLYYFRAAISFLCLFIAGMVLTIYLLHSSVHNCLCSISLSFHNYVGDVEPRKWILPLIDVEGRWDYCEAVSVPCHSTL
jgi:hypothetical protein